MHQFRFFLVEQSTSQIVLTNYERVRDGDIRPDYFTATALDEASVLRIDFYVLPHYLTAPFKKVTEKIMTEFSDLNLCPISNRQGIVIDGEGSKVICKD